MRLRLSALAEGDLQPTAGELCKVEGLFKAVISRKVRLALDLPSNPRYYFFLSREPN